MIAETKIKHELATQEDVARFEIQELLPIGMTIVVLGIGLAFGLQVLGDVRDDVTAGSQEELAINNTIDAVAKLPAKLPLVVSIVIAAVVIGILIRYLFVRFAR